MSRVTDIRVKDLPTDFGALVRMDPPSVIHDEVGYQNAQAMIDRLTSISKRSPGQAKYLETLTILFAAYEDEHHAIDASGIGALDVLRSLVAEHGMTASRLGELLGERSLGSKVLTGSRGLSKGHIRKLADHFGVSTDLFL